MNTAIRENFVTMPIHDQLRFLRKRNRKTQEVVSGLVGVSSRTLRAYESAERIPDYATLSILIEVLCKSSFEVSTLLYTWESASGKQVSYEGTTRMHH